MFKSASSKISIGLVCFLIGMFGVMQFRAQSRLVKAAQTQSTTEQARVINDLMEANDVLSREVQSLEEELARYEIAAGKSELDGMVANLNRLKTINGLVEVSGPGVEITVNGELSETDMQDLVNELRNAGAEAISIGPQRVVARSVILRDKSGIVVDDVGLESPYILRAIGGPDTLERALERKGGLVVILRYNYPEVEIRVEKQNRIVLPVYQGRYDFALAQVSK